MAQIRTYRKPGERPTRGRAIRMNCLACVCGNTAEVRRCHLRDCALWPYRLGKLDTKGLEDEKKGTFPGAPGACESEHAHDPL